jgi:hypothetical protein
MNFRLSDTRDLAMSSPPFLAAAIAGGLAVNFPELNSFFTKRISDTFDELHHSPAEHSNESPPQVTLLPFPDRSLEQMLKFSLKPSLG